ACDRPSDRDGMNQRVTRHSWRATCESLGKANHLAGKVLRLAENRRRGLVPMRVTLGGRGRQGAAATPPATSKGLPGVHPPSTRPPPGLSQRGMVGVG